MKLKKLHTDISFFLPSNALQKLPGKFKNLFRKFENLTVSGVGFHQPLESGKHLWGCRGPICFCSFCGMLGPLPEP